MKQTRKRLSLTVFILIMLLAWGLVLNVNIGSVQIPVGRVFGMVWDALRFKIANLFTGGAYEAQLNAVLQASSESKIVFSIRMPRMLLAAILGGALSVSGFLLQTFFRNPIAGHFCIGNFFRRKNVSGYYHDIFERLSEKNHFRHAGFVCLAGSLLIVGIILLFSQKVKNMSMLLVIGIMVGYICSAVTDFAVAFAKEYDIVNLTSWFSGKLFRGKLESCGDFCGYLPAGTFVFLAAFQANRGVCSGGGLCPEYGDSHKAVPLPADFIIQPSFCLRNGFCRADFLCWHCGTAYYQKSVKDLKTGTGDSGELPLRGGVLRLL